MVKAVCDNLARPEPRAHFTIGINDDVSHTSRDYDSEFSIEPDSVIRALFYGLGADGTVGANKNSIKIIGENTANYSKVNVGLALTIWSAANLFELFGLESEFHCLPSKIWPSC